jgi:endonuclease/exonuclease/phosphatase family metal-dependent hydrolase
MRIITCNIRYFGGPDGENHWTHRRQLCIDVIRDQRPDVICCQEVWREQMDDLEDGLPEFASYGMPDEPTGANPVNPVFYRKDSFTCLGQAGYWLSETPHVAGSSSWDSSCVRLANWVRLIDTKTGVAFRVINTHLDHVSQEAREQQARIISEDAAAYPDDYPQLLTGDMNCDGHNAAIRVFQQAGWADTHAAVHGPDDPGFTYHGFQGAEYQSALGKMDWILARGQAQVRAAEVIAEQRDGRFPSDHYFVSADVQL